MRNPRLRSEIVRNSWELGKKNSALLGDASSHAICRRLCHYREGTARWFHRRNAGWILKVKQQKTKHKLRASDSGKETTQTKTRSVKWPRNTCLWGREPPHSFMVSECEQRLHT